MTEGDKELKVYEIGYILVPTLTEEAASTVAGSIIAALQKNGGTVIASDTPRMRSLAYEVAKVFEHKRTAYTSGYFGWIKFEVSPSSITAISREVASRPEVLRFLPIITTKAGPLPPRTPRRAPPIRETGPSEPKQEISTEQIDKEIEEILAKAI